MASATVSIVYETSDAVVATWRQVTILAFREHMTPEPLQVCVSVTNRTALEMPACVLTIIGERATVPDTEVMRAAVSMLQTTRSVCRARVVAGSGLRASAIRGAIESAQASSGDKRPQGQFTTIPEATAWLAFTMGKDATWRQQLSAVAGTLLYGSPSYSRRSQIAPYLAGEDVSRSDPPGDGDKPRRG